MNGKLVNAVVFCLAVCCSLSAGIVWENPKNLASEADVVTNGVPLFASYFCYDNAYVFNTNGTTKKTYYSQYRARTTYLKLNGERFFRVNLPYGYGRLGKYLTFEPLGQDGALRTDKGFSDTWTYDFAKVTKDVGDGTVSTNFLWNLSAASSDLSNYEYLHLFRSAAMFNNSSVPRSRVTLGGLVPGRSYLVQFWSNDARKGALDEQMDVVGENTKTITFKTGADAGGQSIVGRFVATRPTEVFYFDRKTSNRMLMNAMQVRDVTPNSGITWKVNNVTGRESDILNVGRQVFAYSHATNDYTVNGVRFESQWGYVQDDGTWKNTTYANIYPRSTYKSTYFTTLDQLPTDYTKNVNWEWLKDHTFPEGTSYDYQEILRSCKRGSKDYVTADEAGTNVVFRLLNLTPGRTYAFQMIVSDYRWYGRGRYVELYNADGTTAKLWFNRYDYSANPQVGDTLGQSAIGYFVATAETKDIDVCFRVDHTRMNDPTKTFYPLYEVFQLRELTTNEIAWDDAQPITSDADVSTEGTLLYAHNTAKSTDSALTVNGVDFAPGGNYQSMARPCFGGNAEIAGVFSVNEQKFNALNDKSLTDAAYVPASYATFEGFSKNYFDLLGTGYRAQDEESTVVTLKNLTPGATYLVQYWCNWSNTNIAGRARMCVDGLFDSMSLMCRATNEPFGFHQTGRFLATGTNQTFTLHAFSTSSTRTYPLVNALQVRTLVPLPKPADSTITWTGHYVDSAEAVTNVGTQVFAYNLGKFAQADSPSPATVNGVTFEFKDNTNRMENVKNNIQTISPNLQVKGLSRGAFDGFTDKQGDYLNYGFLLYAGWYGYESGSFTLNQLTPGHRYLVQVFVTDARSGTTSDPDMYWGQHRWLTLDNNNDVKIYYQAPSNTTDRIWSSHLYGMVATGEFFADNVTKTFTAQACHDEVLSSGSYQINAIQLRDLGARTYDGIYEGARLEQTEDQGAEFSATAENLANITIVNGSATITAEASVPALATVYATNGTYFTTQQALADLTLIGEGTLSGLFSFDTILTGANTLTPNFVNAQITKAGLFDLILTGADSGTVTNIVNEGRVVLVNDESAADYVVQCAEGAVVDLSGTSQKIVELNASTRLANGTIANPSTGAIVLTGSATLPNTVQFAEGTAIQVEVANLALGDVLLRVTDGYTGTVEPTFTISPNPLNLKVYRKVAGDDTIWRAMSRGIVINFR